MMICNNCVLDENFPGIAFDEKGLCNHCRHQKEEDERLLLRQKYEDKFKVLIEEYKGKNSYDCLLAYSGGKDSTYTLYLLKKKYGLRVLALSYDNWFQSQKANENIRNVVQHLNVDHLTVAPSFETFQQIIKEVVTGSEIYSPKALERASSICTTCISLIRFACFKLALEKEIPFIIFGMSPGQAPIATSVVRTNPGMIKKTQDIIYQPLYKLLGDKIRPYFLEERDFAKKERFPYSINPLSFSDYNEETILQTIYEFGWRNPDDTDRNSTNCLLNSFANAVHKKQYGYNPYAFELANLVRDGNLDRLTALEKLQQQEDPHIIAMVKEKLSITGDFSGN